LEKGGEGEDEDCFGQGVLAVGEGGAQIRQQNDHLGKEDNTT